MSTRQNVKLSVIIPIYNELNTILEIIKRVQNERHEKEIIIVDDGSTDGSREVIESIEGADIQKVFHKKNRGKGAAIRTALEYVTGDIVIIQDADLEYNPSDYGALIDPILKGVADVVYGSRMIGGRPQRVFMFWHKLGNDFLTFLANILYNTALTDMEAGYKVFKREIIKNLNIKSNGFSVEPEITAKIFKKKYRVYQVPISYYGRNYSEGKKINWKHGFSAIWTLLWYRIFE